MAQGVLFHSGKVREMRKQLVLSDKLETVITLASGAFCGTDVSACILYLNDKKSHTHKRRICLIDGSEVYAPKRAQNELSPDNIQTLYDLYIDYTHVIERCKIVTLKDAEDGGYDLSVKRYIEWKKQETIPPAVVRQNYFAALEAIRPAKPKMRNLLIEGGYVHE